MATTSKQKPINTNYELFILALSVLSIFNLIVEFLPINPYVINLVVIFDVALTPIFLADFCYRLFSAPSKVGLQEIKRIIVEQEQYTLILKKRLESIEGLLQEKVE